MSSNKKCEWFAPANPRARGTRDAFSELMPPPGISGVYAIASLDTGQVFYVGESHTGRLRKTLIRHLQIWNDATQPRAVYDRFSVQVCWLKTTEAEAMNVEADWIDELDPRDNLAEPLQFGYPARAQQAAQAAEEEPPF